MSQMRVALTWATKVQDLNRNRNVPGMEIIGSRYEGTRSPLQSRLTPSL